MVYCRGCGKQIHESAVSCPHCGAQQKSVLSNILQKRCIAFLFALCGGTIGLHKFYLGQVWMGILYLLFCWTAIPTVIGIIEAVYYLWLSDADFSAKYGA